MTLHRLILGSTAPLVAAVATGLLLPRGPVSPGEAVASLIVCGLAGVLSGLLLRSRWAILLAPALFAAVVEITRIRAVGPTVDLTRPVGMYGWLAVLAGRGVHGLLALAPMALGAAWGVGLARRSASRRPSGAVEVPGATGGRVWPMVRRAAAVALTACLVALGVVVSRPAETSAIVGADGRPRPGSVAELTRVPAAQRELSVLIRGRDAHAPVVLYLAGGPGGSELGAMRRHGQALEEHFVVATLDQRGTGRSYDQLDVGTAYTHRSALDDVADVTDYLRHRFDEDRIILVGQSWGTLLGTMAAQEHPERYAALVGVGQMVDPFETDRIMYDDTLAWARRTGDSALAAELERLGPPPYDDLLDLAVTSGQEQEVYAYDHSVNDEGAGQMLENVLVPEYGPMDLVAVVRGLLDTIVQLYPQLGEVDLRRDVPRLAVPVVLAEGRYEPGARADLAAQWFDALDAPAKQWVEFDTSGHRPIFEQPEEFADLMTDTVLPLTRHHTTMGDIS